MVIDYKNVTIKRGDKVLFRNIDLQAEEGEFIYLTGKVGSGKSSLFKTMYRELKISDSECAEVLGFNLRKIGFSKVQKLRRRIGVIFQDFQLFQDQTVAENLDFVLRVTGWSQNSARKERIEEVLEMVGMKGFEKNLVATLSQGEQQRVVIARAILNKPQLIIADEPTGNLDNQTACEIVKMLHTIRGQYNSTIIMATHNMSFITEYPGRHLIVPGNGELKEQTGIEAEPQTEPQDGQAATLQDSEADLVDDPQEEP